MKRILLAVGDTATSLQTARQIRGWLRERETSLTMLSVVTSSALSPLSPVKHMLEQTEAIFTGADEQPGILVRVGSDPAAELCDQVRQGGYDLLAMGLRSQHRSDRAIGTTCRAVLAACPASLFITPPVLHLGMTPQILIAVDQVELPPDMLHWLVAQCQAQHLNAILYASSAEKAAPLDHHLRRAGIRVQMITRPQFATSDLCFWSQDRRVRWIVMPIRAAHRETGLPEVESLLGRATCPVLLVPRHPD